MESATEIEDKQGRSIYQMDSINILSIHNVCKIRKDLFLNVIDSKTGRSFDNSNNKIELDRDKFVNDLNQSSPKTIEVRFIKAMNE